MKKKYFYGCIHPVMVFMLLLLVPSLSFGQDVITSIPPLYSTNSVIREIGSGITLTYDEPPSFTTQKHRFIYNDENGITLVAEISNNYFINDMEIADGQVYFCGRKEGSVTQGMFGYFNINDVCN